MKMNHTATKHQPNPLLKVVKSFFTKFVKNSDEYPVKYYKRDKAFSKMRRT